MDWNGDAIKMIAGQTPPDLIAFNDTLSFENDTYYQAFSQTDTIRFNVDTLNSVYSNWTVARIDANGDPIYFEGAHWDSVQFYNIASGDTLSGVHMLYFEYSPWGTLVSVPTNSRTTQDTLEGGNNSPAQSIPGLLAEFDGQTELSEDGTTTTWVDQSLFGRVAENTDPARQPIVAGAGPDFDQDALVFTPSLTATTDFSITFAFSPDNASVDHMVLGKTGSGGNYIMYRNSSITSNNLHYRTALWTVPVLTASAHIVQIICTGGSCEGFVDGTCYGSTTAPALTDYDVLGDFQDAGSVQSTRGIIHYMSIHSAAYSTQQRTDLYDYINNRFSLGL